MKKEIEDIFNNYDYGFNLDLISAESWIQDSGHFYRKIYLENNSVLGSPLSAYFHVYFHKNEAIREVSVEMVKK